MKTPANVFAHDTASSLEARFGLRVAAALTRRVDAADPDIRERLRFAREQALERVRAQRRAVATAGSQTVAVGMSASGAAVLGSHPAWWTRLASLVPLAVLVGGLFLIDQSLDRAQINAAADVDSALLADDLPPAAYSDPGFVEFLKNPRD